VKALDRFLQRWRIRMAVPFVRQGDRLLDVGCYDRSLIDRVLPRIESAVGVDTDVSPLLDADVEIIKGHFPDEPRFEASTFDCITMLAVLEHVEEPSVLARECERILAPNGRLILTVPHPAVDAVLDTLMFLGIADGMSTEEHHGFDVELTQAIFEGADLRLHHKRKFQLGLNRLFVFEKPINRSVTV
jgi:2-polyprenyl-3-methyl-5-hydroxy-6-metoxy-1,4-benzoquinol methylase